ncbi:MAG: hypothetical protein OEZ51_09485 [Nitrospinota bacterium]|nr:hypothetical protein [Nitrospinota bacterium]
MSQAERFLLALQGKDERKIVLEFESEHFLSGKLKAAQELDVWVRRLSAEGFASDEYKNALHFDMRHSSHSAIFHLEQWKNYLKMESNSS